MPPRKRRAPKKSKKVAQILRHRPWRGWVFRNFVLWSIVAGLLYVLFLDLRIKEEFEGKKWAIPARVYGRALELYPGLPLTADQLEHELILLKYQSGATADRPGSYQRSEESFHLVSRPFHFWDGAEESRDLNLTLANGQILEITERRSGKSVPLVRLDPFQLATIIPSRHEDRILVKRDELPKYLVQSLLAVEDRHYFSHFGLDWRGLARAMWVNLSSFSLSQGGSTLTQQLVKNFFLDNERTLTRKVNEAIMSVLLEVHYDKDAILEAYCNEVFLGQDGQRAIHGFGLAARFYFGNDLEQLRLPELALLVGMVKGPSLYDPRRHPERAKERRAQVLAELASEGYITPAQQKAANDAPLAVVPAAGRVSRFPAYLELVRKQLHNDYRDEDLKSEGLQVFTALDPQAQLAAEHAVSVQVSELEKAKKLDGALQGAFIATNAGSGEVVALVGDRDPAAMGFNRALAAQRQIGSLVKPAVYLTALLSKRYTLVTPLDDSLLTLTDETGKEWTPHNYDDQYHGPVPFYSALANSYNAATVRLGVDIGVKNVVQTIHQLGVTREFAPYPSLLLGTPELSLLEVAQMYQTLAAGGFVMPLRSIRAVLSSDGHPLQRYGLAVEQSVDPVAAYLLNAALQSVAHGGTAKNLANLIGADLTPAVKTGTTNDLRDSWFAGFTADRLAVAWVGRDDNKPAGFTGASGAMKIWANFMQSEHGQKLELLAPDGVEWSWVEPETGLLSTQDCPGAQQLPFAAGQAPVEQSECLKQHSSFFNQIFQ